MTLPWSLAPISPVQNATIAVTSTTQAVALGGALVVGQNSVNGPNTVIVNNVGTNEAFLAFGDSNTTVTAGGTVTLANDGGACVPAGAIVSFSANLPTCTHAAAICRSGLTTTLRLTRGYGS